MDAIRISVELAEKDLVNFSYSNWVSAFNKKTRDSYLISLILSGLLGVSFLISLKTIILKTGISTFDLVIIPVGTLAIAIYYRYFAIKSSLPDKIKKLYSDPCNRNTFLITEILISEEGVETKDVATTAIYKWIAIVRVLETTDYYFLYLNSIQAIIIPKQKLDPGLRNTVTALLENRILKENYFIQK